MVIRIHHKEKIAICLGDAKVDCTWFPAVLDLVIVDIKSIILVFPLRDQLAGVVGRTIVHTDGTPMRICLSKHTVQTTTQVQFNIINGNDNINFVSFHILTFRRYVNNRVLLCKNNKYF